MKKTENSRLSNDLIVSTFCSMIYCVSCEASGITDEQVQTIDWIMEQKLNDIEYGVITRHLGLEGGKRWELDEIAKYFGIPRAHVRSIEAKALRKMRHPDFIGMLPSGLVDSSDEEEKLNELIEEMDQLRQNPIFRKERELKGAIRRLMVSRKPFKYVSRAINHLLIDVPIEYLELSFRAYNCLKRAKINTVGDVINLIEHNNLSSVKNLGKKAQEEVAISIGEFKCFVLENTIL